ncbi:hypothetical protein FSP39_011546 [Pinctada imbricata]|uniref:Uncharacterized protein n=1 Tax=Pinctada imbricata TaxID=66713 RepID=A0AA89BLW9_PINIB|nr:hypothetical protein FSP39_011546 [Pinctada imbricata]
MSIAHKDILNLDVISKFVNEGFGGLPEEYRPVFTTLLEFVKGIDLHQKALDKVITCSREADVMPALAIHLFSQLVPRHAVEVDDTSKIGEHCPCGCLRKIPRGLTSLGSFDTWHGHADIIVNQKVPIIFIEKRKQEEIMKMGGQNPDSDEEDTDSNSVCVETEVDRNYDMDNEGPSKKKQKTNDEGRDMATFYGTLQDYNVIGKIIAQTVTNSFIQVNFNKDLSSLMIPAIGCTDQEFCIYLYNPEEDILLHSMRDEKFWLIKSKLDLDAVIILWLFLNFTTFVKPKLVEEFYFEQSGIHQSLGSHIELYKKCKYKENFTNGATVDYEHFIYPRLPTLVRKIKRKSTIY